MHFLNFIKGHQYANVHQNATTKPLEELILREHKQGKDKKGQKKGQNTNEMALRLLSIEVKKFLEPFVLSVPWYFSLAHLPLWRV